MGLFDRIERSGEAVANRLVHKDAQPLDTIEITSKLIETMDKKATAFSRDRTVAPNVFQVSLAPINFDQINAWGSSVLASEMSQELIRHAHTQGYSFIGQITISFAAEPSLNPHAIHVNAFTRKDASAPVTRPTITSPILDINGQRYMLTGPVTIIGRGSESDIIVDDSGVSRRHLEIRLTAGHTVATDLGSTNGTFVEGVRMDAATLVNGNTITIGHTTIMFWDGSDEVAG